MEGRIVPHLYLLFGIVIFILNEGAFQSSGFYGSLFYYLSLAMIIISIIIIVINLFRRMNQ